MVDPRATADGLLGKVEWASEVSGFCRCPGEAMHTSPNGKKDCRVNIDGAPTIFCFHASCAPAVTEANRRLRRELGGSPWELRLPDGQVLRSEDVMKNSLTQSREEASGDDVEVRGSRPYHRRVPAHATQYRQELFDFFRWPFQQIVEDSALLVTHRDPDEQFRIWLSQQFIAAVTAT